MFFFYNKQEGQSKFQFISDLFGRNFDDIICCCVGGLVSCFTGFIVIFGFIWQKHALLSLVEMFEIFTGPLVNRYAGSKSNEIALHMHEFTCFFRVFLKGLSPRSRALWK